MERLTSICAGPYLHYADVSKLDTRAKATQHDAVTFQEVFVEYPSDIGRLKKEAAAFAAERYGEEGAANADFFVIANATLVTMETGHVQSDLLHDAVLVTRGGEIEAIVGVHDFVAPYGATILDAEGGTYRPATQVVVRPDTFL